MLGADAALSVRFYPLNRFLQPPIGRRGFVGVIFPLMRSKDFLHHPVYISSRCSEYNRGSSYHRAFYAPMSFCSFLPLKIFAKQKQGNAAALSHTTLPCIAQSDTRPHIAATIQYAVWVFCYIKIWVMLLVQHYNTNIAPASTNHYMRYTNSRPCRGQPCAIVSMP